MQKVCLLPWPKHSMFNTFRKTSKRKLTTKKNKTNKFEISLSNEQTTLYSIIFNVKKFKTAFSLDFMRKFQQLLRNFHDHGLCWSRVFADLRDSCRATTKISLIVFWPISLSESVCIFRYEMVLGWLKIPLPLMVKYRNDLKIHYMYRYLVETSAMYKYESSEQIDINLGKSLSSQQ